MNTRIWVGVGAGVGMLVITSSIILNGCDKKSPEAEPKSPTMTTTAATGHLTPPVSAPSATVEVVAPHLVTSVQKAQYALPACQGDQCPQVDIKRLETSEQWVNQFLDHQILKFSQGFSEKPSDRLSLQQNIDAFVNVSNQDVREGGMGVPYTMSIDVEDLGQRGANLAQFKVHGDFYTGGAHGSVVNSYYVLDLSKHKQVKLDDLLISGQKNKLYNVVYPEFVRWVKAGDPAVNMKEYEAMWKFTLAHNFTLNKKGLTFYYGQYDIGPYVAGMPEFTIPYTQLNGIIKPEYL